MMFTILMSVKVQPFTKEMNLKNEVTFFMMKEGSKCEEESLYSPLWRLY